MPITWGPLGTSNGLILCLDAANPKSTKASDGWYNVSGLWEKVDKIDSPTLGIKGGALCYIFDSVGERFQSSPLGFQNPTNFLTMEAWIYPEADLPGAGDRMNIIRTNAGGSRGYLSFNRSNNKISNYWYGTSVEGYHETVSYTPGRNTWQHFCATWNGSQIKQYVNYQYQGTALTNSQGQSFGTELQIGWEGTGRQFNGGIAMIRLYNRALTDAEVFLNFNSTKGRFGF